MIVGKESRNGSAVDVSLGTASHPVMSQESRAMAIIVFFYHWEYGIRVNSEDAAGRPLGFRKTPHTLLRPPSPRKNSSRTKRTIAYCAGRKTTVRFAAGAPCQASHTGRTANRKLHTLLVHELTGRTPDPQPTPRPKNHPAACLLPGSAHPMLVSGHRGPASHHEQQPSRPNVRRRRWRLGR
jgi:hypothetical protein